MDYITSAVLTVLEAQNVVLPGTNVVYEVEHYLDGVTASKSYFKGVSAGSSFAETLIGDAMTVSVIMGDEDITEKVYKDGYLAIPFVTGNLVITAKAAFSLGNRLQSLPAAYYGVNLWPLLRHDTDYYTVDGWGKHPSGKVHSVTIPVREGERIYASSFESMDKNGGMANGVRVTFFSSSDTLVSLSAPEVYAALYQNGYLPVPEGANAVSIPMWTDSADWVLYVWPAFGDVNGDGICSVLDAILLQQYLNNWDVEVYAHACDTDDDGKVNNWDLVMLIRYLNGWTCV